DICADFAIVALSRNGKPPARVFHAKQYSIVLLLSCAFLRQRDFARWLAGDERLRLSTPQTFEKV
ncbi:MAG: hypothetical protein IKJ63_05750, partial [Clostridia bacterium]|nr:hypothetical protein [Clostridia bacterium]